MLVKLSTLPPLKYPLMAPGASKMKFYNLFDTMLLVLRVNCCSDVQKCPQSIDIYWFPGHFCRLTRQYPVKYPAQFTIDIEEKIWWFEKTAIFAAGHFKRWPLWRLWLYMLICTLSHIKRRVFIRKIFNNRDVCPIAKTCYMWIFVYIWKTVK